MAPSSRNASEALVHRTASMAWEQGLAAKMKHTDDSAGKESWVSLPNSSLFSLHGLK